MPPTEQVQLSATIAPLGEPADACAWLAEQGVRGVQFSATQPATRPRDLGASARRDIRSMVQRLGLEVSGIDLWIPPEHFLDPANAERAVDAVRHACSFASFLGRVPVALAFPAAPAAEDPRAALHADAARAVTAAAAHEGVRLAVAPETLAPLATPPAGALIDPAAVLAAGGDPAAAVAKAAGTLVAARVVDLLRSGLRGPVGAGSEARLDLTAYRVALELAGVRLLPVVDARQWPQPRPGLLQSVQAWIDAVPALGARPSR